MCKIWFLLSVPGDDNYNFHCKHRRNAWALHGILLCQPRRSFPIPLLLFPQDGQRKLGGLMCGNLVFRFLDSEGSHLISRPLYQPGLTFPIHQDDKWKEHCNCMSSMKPL